MNENQGIGRHLAYLLIGAAAGVLGSRLLPPVLANLNGARQGRNGGDPFEPLIDDHRLILSTLDAMVEAPPDANASRVKLFLTLKRTLGKHAMAEEDVVYPILHQQGQRPEDSKELYDEHADMKIRLYELEGLLKDRADWRAPVESLRALIREHIEEEERDVFPQLRRLLDPPQVATVSGQIRREEALVL